MKTTLLLALISCVLGGSLGFHAQTGGQYQIEKSVIVPGGNSSAAGSYSLESTTGQTVTGRTQSSAYSVDTGFWTPELTPTAASVSVGGRVLTPDGEGLFNATVTMVDTLGNARVALTNPFGYYRFEEVEIGQGYLFQVRSKRYQFAPQFRTIVDELTNLDFTAEPGNQ